MTDCPCEHCQRARQLADLNLATVDPDDYLWEIELSEYILADQ